MAPWRHASVAAWRQQCKQSPRLASLNQKTHKSTLCNYSIHEHSCSRHIDQPCLWTHWIRTWIHIDPVSACQPSAVFFIQGLETREKCKYKNWLCHCQKYIWYEHNLLEAKQGHGQEFFSRNFLNSFFYNWWPWTFAKGSRLINRKNFIQLYCSLVAETTIFFTCFDTFCII